MCSVLVNGTAEVYFQLANSLIGRKQRWLNACLVHSTHKITGNKDLSTIEHKDLIHGAVLRASLNRAHWDWIMRLSIAYNERKNPDTPFHADLTQYLRQAARCHKITVVNSLL